MLACIAKDYFPRKPKLFIKLDLGYISSASDVRLLSRIIELCSFEFIERFNMTN